MDVSYQRDDIPSMSASLNKNFNQVPTMQATDEEEAKQIETRI